MSWNGYRRLDLLVVLGTRQPPVGKSCLARHPRFPVLPSPGRTPFVDARLGAAALFLLLPPAPVPSGGCSSLSGAADPRTVFGRPPGIFEVGVSAPGAGPAQQLPIGIRDQSHEVNEGEILRRLRLCFRRACNPIKMSAGCFRGPESRPSIFLPD